MSYILFVVLFLDIILASQHYYRCCHGRYEFVLRIQTIHIFIIIIIIMQEGNVQNQIESMLSQTYN